MYKRTSALLAIVLALVLVSCEEDVTPITGSNLPFSMYGVISPRLDTQMVKLYLVEPILLPETRPTLDATVVSEDLQTGEKRTWIDSLVTDVDGQKVHIYYSIFKAEYGHTYKLTATHTRTNLSSYVQVKVPAASEIEIEERTLNPPVTINANVPGDIPRLMNIIVEYYVRYGGSPNPLEVQQLFQFNYNEYPRKGPKGWFVPINMSEDYNLMQQRLIDTRKYQPSYGIAIINMRVHLAAVNEEWNPPGGVFDANVLVQPGVMENVQNGFGFVGAGYKLTTSFLPGENVQFAAGFSRLR